MPCPDSVCWHFCVYKQKTLSVVPKFSNNWVLRLQYLLQLLNLALYVGSNSFILAHPCHWFGPLPTVFNYLRGTCINTTLALLHVFAVGTQPWVDRAGTSYLCKSLLLFIFCSTNWFRDLTSHKGWINMHSISMSNTSNIPCWYLFEYWINLLSINNYLFWAHVKLHSTNIHN